MALEVPNEIQRGSPILADFLNGIVRAVKANRIMPGTGILTAQNSGGTVVSTIPKGGATAEMPPHYTYAFSATEVKVTAGQVIYPTNELIVVVADSAALTVSNNDKVWLERTGATTWVAAVGASYPTTTGKIHIPLATVAISGSVMTVAMMVRDNSETSSPRATFQSIREKKLPSTRSSSDSVTTGSCSSGS
jgi:hypothetical protein